VLKLTRVAEGPLLLGDLEEGKWRKLSDKEIRKLKGV
jgi:16S rRNA U516 pseudouridylate synthase RsuA-like enzyme